MSEGHRPFCPATEGFRGLQCEDEEEGRRVSERGLRGEIARILTTTTRNEKDTWILGFQGFLDIASDRFASRPRDAGYRPCASTGAESGVSA